MFPTLFHVNQVIVLGTLQTIVGMVSLCPRATQFFPADVRIDCKKERFRMEQSREIYLYIQHHLA